ncbi:MAG: 23S rRNA (guanosine2251-2'-O)-methyltransferase [Candidatus Azotimanducaceae bacterium]|jgi:23S rRNA (guanosine2251-2'-O)-methyltransferase
MATIFGINSVLGRMQQTKGISRLLLREGDLSSRLSDALERAKSVGIPCTRLSEQAFASLTRVNHQGVGLEVDHIRTLDESALYALLEEPPEQLLFLILDGVTDPRNLGACIRSAATLGVHAVIQPRDRSAALTDAAVKTASGAASAVPVIEVVNLARAMKELQQNGVWIVGTTLDADQSLSQMDLKGPIALVLGSEEKGIRAGTAKHCDFLASIPMNNPGFGFNVSVAAGICLYEVSRQRRP